MHAAQLEHFGGGSIALNESGKPLLTDARMLGGQSGVATYALAVRAAQLRLDPAAGLLAGPPLHGAQAKARRVARALVPGDVRAQSEAGGFVFPDLFRLAHVHFTVRRRLLTVAVPGPPGLIHWTYPVPLRLVGWRNLYTVHDVIPLIRPDLSPIDPHRHARVLAQVLDAADRVVTVSQAARAEIVGWSGCDPALVVDCSQAVEPPAQSRAPPLGLAPGGYLLVVGAIEPRKNLARLLAGYRASGAASPLVVAGPDGWDAERIAPLMAATPNVRRAPYLDRPELLALVAGARALLMPSLAEGFGLPIAEAMALGVPVLASRGGATEEVAGGAALLVDPRDERAIAAAIGRLASDDRLCADLAARGRAAARRFTPERFAERLGRLYADVFAGADRAR